MTVDAEWKETEMETNIHSWYLWNSYLNWKVPRISAVAKQGERKVTQKISEALEEENIEQEYQRWRFIVCLADFKSGVNVDIISDPDNEGHVTLRLHHGIHIRILGSVSPSNLFENCSQKYPNWKVTCRVQSNWKLS